jgi:predicted Zn finger-like uncharacterized protein
VLNHRNSKVVLEPMALHKTQCPHCFTTYVISGEQLRMSEGMVRCGTCRERFQARVLVGETETPRFDPRDAFIEPLTEESDKQQQSDAIADVIADAEAEPQEFTFADPHTESKKSISVSGATASVPVSSEKSLDIDHETAITPFHSNQLSAAKMLANIRAKQALTEERREIEEGGASSDNDAATNAVNQKTAQHELALPVNKRTRVDANNNVETPKKSTQSASSSSGKTAGGVFQLDRKPKRKWHAWLLTPPLLAIIAVLIGALMYQLWMKQILLFKDNPLVQTSIAELRVPIANKLAEYNVVLPPRRNLSKLELASAHTEPHPTRSSTILLRISIINHAQIEQPLPWLEMSLTDAEGQLVSRRKLSPEDYVYQNATNNLIGARELKKVTIELLSFPKSATGYEVKLLSK